MRDFSEITDRIRSSRAPDLAIDELARIQGYPVHRVRMGGASACPPVLLMGGTHGDEPAGVETCLQVLEQGLGHWTDRFAFEVVPCLNPVGYVHDTRHNAQDVDINWAYQRDDVPEVQAVRQLVAHRRFEFVLDFHEDWESPGYYLYELRRGAPVMGASVVEAVRSVCPVNTDAEIDGLPATSGLIAPDPHQEVEQRGAGIPLVMYFHHTDHLLTSESPTGLDMSARTRAHRTALEVVLQAHDQMQQAGIRPGFCPQGSAMQSAGKGRLQPG